MGIDIFDLMVTSTWGTLYEFHILAVFISQPILDAKRAMLLVGQVHSNLCPLRLGRTCMDDFIDSSR